MFDDFRREVLVGIIVITGSIFIFGAGFYFFSKSLRADAQYIAEDRLLIAESSAILASFAELKRDASLAVRYEKAMERLLVPKDHLIDFPRWLEGLARVRQVGLNFSFSGSEVGPQEDYPGYINFSLDVTGNFDAIAAFLKDAESQSVRFLLNLDTFDVTRGGSGYRVFSRGRVFFK